MTKRMYGERWKRIQATHNYMAARPRIIEERKPPVTPAREGLVRRDYRCSAESVERGKLTRRLKSVKVTLAKMPWETA